MRMSLFVRCAGVSVALFVASLISFPSLPNPAAGWFTLHPAVTVNRALKGDRLPLADPIADRSRELGLPVSPAPSQAREKVPLGCDSAFSPISSPWLANVFRRCMV